MEKVDDFYDEMKLSSDKEVLKSLGPSEKILLSTIISKYNYKGKKQERIILITDSFIYNLSMPGIFSDIISKMSSFGRIRRKIPIDKVTAVSISKLSSEFVIHIPTEYDYRYSSDLKREIILEVLTKAYIEKTQKKYLAFYYKDEVNLINITTTKFDVKKSICRRPKDTPTYVDEKTYKAVHAKTLRDTVSMGSTKDSQMMFSRSKATPDISIYDFNLIRVLGRGAFGKVMLVERKETKELYALKSIRKKDIIEKDQIEHMKTERRILEYVEHPFLVGLEFAFQTNEKIFFVMEFVRGGELFQHLKKIRRFTENQTKFYISEIILGFEYLHDKDVIYRDLKPENILIDDDGHIRITDFGLAKYVGQTTANTFVGTPEYLAPEILTCSGHSKPTDWWSLGILTFELLYGIPPFYNQNQNIMFQSIKEKEVKLPEKFEISDDAKDFIKNLLIKDPLKRLGSKADATEIKAHPWFKTIDWEKVFKKEMEPPFKPQLKSSLDTNNFDEEFTKEDAINSVVDKYGANIVDQYQKEFTNFTYVPDSKILNFE